MANIKTHASLSLVWEIASDKAMRAARDQVEPIDFFYACLFLLDGAIHSELRHLGYPECLIDEICGLAQEIRLLLPISGDEVVRFRRAAGLAGMPPQQRPTQLLHRSERSRALFEQAFEICQKAAAPSASVVHLFKALLSPSYLDVARIISTHGPQKPNIAWQTSVDRFAEEFKVERFTLVFTDIEGSTSIKQAYGDNESAKVFRAHDNLIRRLLAQFSNAREIDQSGDAFLIAFAAEADAVHFALELQSKLRCDLRLSAVPVKVRIGIHAGELLAHDSAFESRAGPIFGIAIDTTSRVASLAVGNQVLVSKSVRDIAESQIAAMKIDGVATVTWTSHGAYEIKGLREPLEIIEVGETGKAVFSSPLGNDKAMPIVLGQRPQKGTPPIGLELVSTPNIDRIGRDLTRLGRDGTLVPILGRRREMITLGRYLIRTSKRNVIIVGEAGVGKSALVEGLACIASTALAPSSIRDLRFVQINVADLVAGTRYRGDVEERIKAIVNEAIRNPNTVLVFDEIHLMIGAGSTTKNGIDVANILKPALVGDKLRCIGTTTIEEFERHMRSDVAFMRRFQVFKLAEPSIEETMQICNARAHRISDIQSVDIDSAAIRAAVTLAVHRIANRRLPDQAIDLLENAATLVKLTSLNHSQLLSKNRPKVGVAEIEAALSDQYGIQASVPK